jgi:glucose/arabinose dehydrogenase
MTSAWMKSTVAIAAPFAVFLASTALADPQAPGTRIKIDVADLARPGDTPSSSNGPRPISKSASVTLNAPPGFTVNVFAENLTNARNLVVAANGDVLLAESGAGKITLLRDADGDGKAETVTTFAEGFRYAHGIAFGKDCLYIGDTEGVWRLAYTVGDTVARAKQTRVTPDGAFGSRGGHITRNVVISPDGRKLLVSIGSAGNIAEEPNPRATIQEFTLNPAGTFAGTQRIFASGLRNPVGTAYYPGTNDLYTVVNERDTLGDELVPDYLTKVADNGFYGWPYSYLGKNPQPGFADRRPDLVAKAIVPDLLFRSHSAPLGLAFYTASQFPAEYQGGAFVALHGSWNAAAPRGYNVVYVPFENKRPRGDYIVFASGFWSGTGANAEVWGRPAGVAVAKDGSLLIADDGSDTVWRVSYKN